METNQILSAVLIIIVLIAGLGVIINTTFYRIDEQAERQKEEVFLSTYKEMQDVIDEKDSLLSKQALEIRELKGLVEKHSEKRVIALNSANKNAKQNSYLKKKITNLSTDLGYNNIVGYKFKPEQEVFVIDDGEIKKGTIDYIGIEVFEADYEVYYVIKELSTPVYEDEVFATKEMATIRLSELTSNK